MLKIIVTQSHNALSANSIPRPAEKAGQEREAKKLKFSTFDLFLAGGDRIILTSGRMQ